MEKHRAIPQGYMTVGELAKKMGVTVSTLHHYDKTGLLSPSSESEGGFRLYSDKDMMKLHQILSMKHVGFSLEDIKNRLVHLNTPEDVANALTEQANSLRRKIETLAESLQAIEALKAEVVQMDTVDFRKYADIILNMQMKNETYWMLKYLDQDIIDQLSNQFNYDKSRAKAMIETMNRLNKKSFQLEADGESPESEKGQEFAKEYWEMVMEITGGDMNLLLKLNKITEEMRKSDDAHWKEFSAFDKFLEAALYAYFASQGYNPFNSNHDNKHEEGNK